MLSMVSAMVLFAFARWLRGDAANQPDTVILAIEGLGAIALMFGGWLMAAGPGRSDNLCWTAVRAGESL